MASRFASYVIPAILFLGVASPAFATWSVIAVDQKTREVAIASAICVPQAAFAMFPARGLMDVQAIVVPGKGVAAAAAACESKTSHVAYILRADPADTNGASFNDGQYALYIAVTNDDIQPAENANPVKTLRLRYEAWKKAHSPVRRSPGGGGR